MKDQTVVPTLPSNGVSQSAHSGTNKLDLELPNGTSNGVVGDEPIRPDFSQELIVRDEVIDTSQKLEKQAKRSGMSKVASSAVPFDAERAFIEPGEGAVYIYRFVGRH